MPTLSQTFTLDVSPEKYIRHCSREELIELDLLLQSPSVQAKMTMPVKPVMINERKCRECGCTQNDCSHCIEKTGHPCFWLEPDLCSACKA